MAVKTIAYSYWRSIQRGVRAFASVPVELQNDVKAIAAEDVVINADQYEQFIGEPLATE